MAFNFDEFAAKNTPQTPATTAGAGKFNFEQFASQGSQIGQVQNQPTQQVQQSKPIDIESELGISTEVGRIYSQTARLLRDARKLPDEDPRKAQILQLVEANNQKAEELKSKREQVSSEPGFFQNLATGIAKPFLKTAASLQALGTGAVGAGLSGLGAITGSNTLKSAGQRALQEGTQSKIDLGGGFEARPVGTRQDTGEDLSTGQGLLDALGTGLEIGSYAVGGQIPAKTFGSRVVTGLATGAKEGALAGTMGGLGTSLQGGDASFGRSAIGTLGGAALGGVLGGAVGGVVGRLSSRPLQAAEKEIVGDFTRAIKPSTTVKKTAALAEKYDKNIVKAVDTIVDNKKNLVFQSPEGKRIVGRLPENVNEANQALVQSKKAVYEKYNSLTQKTGKAGGEIELTPIADELNNFASDPIITDNNPEIANYASKRAESFLKRGKYNVVDAQRAVEQYNQSLSAFYLNPTYDTASKAAVDALIVNRLNSSLDTIINKSTGAAYKILKSQYGALKAIESDLQRAVNRMANKNNIGLIDYFGIESASDLSSALTSFSPEYFARATTRNAIIQLYKYINSPDRIIKNVFKLAEGVRGKGFNPQSILERAGSSVQKMGSK